MRLPAAVAFVAAATLVASSCTGDGSAGPATTAAAVTTTEAGGGEAPATTSASATTDAGRAASELTVGLLRPIRGLLFPVFQAQSRGLELAADDIAEAGDLLEVEVTEGALGGSELDEATALADTGVTSFVGPIGSTGASDIAGALGERGSVACSASATAASLTPDGNTTLFRTAIPDDVVVTRLAEAVSGARDELDPAASWRIGIIARGDTYGRDLAGGLATALTVRGFEPSVVEYHPFNQLFDAIAGQVAAAGYDAVVLVSYAEGPRLLNDLVQAGVDPARMVGFDSFFVPRLGEIASPGDPTAIDGFRVVGTAGDQAFLDRLTEADPTAQVVSAAKAYDCAVVLALAELIAPDATGADRFEVAIEATRDGRTCTTYDDCAAKALAGEDIDYDGPSGKLDLSDTGDPSFARFVTGTVTDGQVAITASEDVDFADIERSETLVAAASFTTQLQQALALLGFYTGPVDGLYDDDVIAALGAFQSSVGLPATGVYDGPTDEALRASAAGSILPVRDSVVQIQVLLTAFGTYTGPLDGIWSPAVSEAVRGLQRSLGVPESGVFDVATLQAVFDAGFTAGQGSTTTTDPTTTESTTVPSTAAPTTTTPDTTTTTAAPPTTTPPTTVGDLQELLRGDPRFSTLLLLLTTAGFDESTPAGRGFTVLAPTNEAFESLDPALLAQLLTDPNALRAVLAYHVLPGLVTSQQLASLTTGSIVTVHGAELSVVTDGTGLLLGDRARVVEADLEASNGVVHAIDQVLLPPG